MDLHIISFFILATCSRALSQHMVLDAQKAPIVLHHVSVTSPSHDVTNVAVTYFSTYPVEAAWTIDEGFTPYYFNPKTFTSVKKNSNGTLTATIDIPKDLAFNVLRFHLSCEQQSFLVHLALRVSHDLPATLETISPYSVYVPPSSEIGITSRGEARFHVMVNTSGTAFTFGMLQAEADMYTKYTGNNARTYYESNAAYSFLPEDRSKVVRLHKVLENSNEYHADVLVKSDKLFKTGAIVSVLTACTNPSSLIHRMDIKQVMYLHPSGTNVPVKSDQMGFVQEDYNLFVEKNQNALIRCTAIADAQPKVTLHKRGRNGLSAPLNIPSHTTVLKYKFTTVFHIFNVDELKIGEYICAATNGQDKVESTPHKLSLISQQMVQESLK